MSRLQWAALALAAALVFGAVHSDSALCSSLDGPYCDFVNGLSPPSYMPKHESLGEEFNQLLRNFLRETKRDRKPKSTVQVEIGSFLFSGSTSKNKIWLSPKKWIVKPNLGWIMIGFTGGFAVVDENSFQFRRSTLYLTITDPVTGEPVRQCSKFVLRRKSKGLHRSSAFDGEFAGQYSCSGSRTLAKMILISNPHNGSVRGSLSFESTSFLHRDTTLAGCKCVWQWAFGEDEYKSGECGLPKIDNERPWCFIEEGSCTRMASGKNWDYCAKAREPQVVAVLNLEDGQVVMQPDSEHDKEVEEMLLRIHEEHARGE